MGAEGGGSSLANLGHFSPQIPDFSHLHQPGLESLSPNYSVQNSTFISQNFSTYSSKIQNLDLAIRLLRDALAGPRKVSQIGKPTQKES